MTVQRKPISGEYLVYPQDGDVVTEQFRFADDFTVETVPELQGAYLARAKDADASEALLREKLQVAAGADGKVLNLLTDEDGNQLLPTGNLNVLLVEKFSDQELSTWLQDHDLSLVSRSKWRPLSVAVAPASRTETPDKVAQRLENDPTVELVEQDTLMRFTRR